MLTPSTRKRLPQRGFVQVGFGDSKPRFWTRFCSSDLGDVEHIESPLPNEFAIPFGFLAAKTSGSLRRLRPSFTLAIARWQKESYNLRGGSPMRLARGFAAFKQAYRRSIAQSREADRVEQEKDRKRTFRTGPLPVILFILGLLCFGFSAMLWQSFGALAGLAALGLFFAFFWLAYHVGNLLQRSKQQARNATASKVLDQLRRGKEVPFSLFLRPFSSSGKLGQLMFESGREDLFSSDLETSLSKIMEPDHPLVAIGEHGGPPGSGKITSTDQQWRCDFELLACHAYMIFAVFGLSAGVRWELAWLAREAKVRKCIFIMPSGHAKSSELVWRRVQEAYAAIGWRLPAYDRQGCLFRMRPDGTCDDVWPLGNLREWNLGMLLSLISVQDTLNEADRIQAEFPAKFRQLFGRDPDYKSR